MKALLSGMPECKFGLNDKIAMDAQDARAGPGGQKRHAVELVDCTFHRCVRLGKFDADRSITFVPPDGKFDLMQYRISKNIKLPFKVLPVIEESEEKGVKVVNITLKIRAMCVYVTFSAAAAAAAIGLFAFVFFLAPLIAHVVSG